MLVPGGVGGRLNAESRSDDRCAWDAEPFARDHAVAPPLGDLSVLVTWDLHPRLSPIVAPRLTLGGMAWRFIAINCLC